MRVLSYRKPSSCRTWRTVGVVVRYLQCARCESRACSGATLNFRGRAARSVHSIHLPYTAQLPGEPLDSSHACTSLSVDRRKSLHRQAGILAAAATGLRQPATSLSGTHTSATPCALHSDCNCNCSSRVAEAEDLAGGDAARLLGPLPHARNLVPSRLLVHGRVHLWEAGRERVCCSYR